ncbi:hypothetical protein ACJX0J_041179, partial [Zea mays]
GGSKDSGGKPHGATHSEQENREQSTGGGSRIRVPGEHGVQWHRHEPGGVPRDRPARQQRSQCVQRHLVVRHQLPDPDLRRHRRGHVLGQLQHHPRLAPRLPSWHDARHLLGVPAGHRALRSRALVPPHARLAERGVIPRPLPRGLRQRRRARGAAAVRRGPVRRRQRRGPGAQDVLLQLVLHLRRLRHDRLGRLHRVGPAERQLGPRLRHRHRLHRPRLRRIRARHAHVQAPDAHRHAAQEPGPGRGRRAQEGQPQSPRGRQPPLRGPRQDRRAAQDHAHRRVRVPRQGG